MKNNHGFTLLEVIAVVTIIAMLALVIVPIVDKNIKDVQNFASDAQIETFEQAAYVYAISYRSEISSLDTNKVATVTLQTLYDKGLLNQQNLGDISKTNKVVVALIDDEIKTVYDKHQDTSPIIILHGPQQLTMTINTGYDELGAEVVTFSPSLTIAELDISNIDFSGVDSAKADTYKVNYNYTGADTVKRTVTVSTSYVNIDDQKPVITLTGNATMTIVKGVGTYTEPGATALDPPTNVSLTSRIVITGTVNRNQKGTYYIKYDVTDSYGNKADTAIRTVTVN